MSTSRRSRIIFPMVSIVVTAFALSAQAQEQPKGPPQGQAGRSFRQSTRVPDIRGRPEGHKTDISRGCRRTISADMPITVGWPGEAGAGATKSTTGATAGGGMSGAPGISTRNRWKVPRPMCPTSRSWTTPAARMGYRLRQENILRRRQSRTRQPMRRLHRRRLHRMRPQAPLGAPWSVGYLAVLSPDGQAERSPAR